MFWDVDIEGGVNWQQAIDDNLAGARSVLVAWSAIAVGPKGDYVRDEARRAKQLRGDGWHIDEKDGQFRAGYDGLLVCEFESRHVSPRSSVHRTIRRALASQYAVNLLSSRSSQLPPPTSKEPVRMPPIATFNSIIAARTRAAQQILGDKSLLALYEEHGGLKEDLVEIRDLGLRAEALSGAQSAAQAAGGAATVNVLELFADIQREYKAVMAVVSAVRHDLEKAGASSEVLATVEQILVNEAEVAIREVDAGVDAEGKPVTKKKASRKLTQEAIRAEMAKDASALIALKPAHAALGKRKVDLPRLKKLKAGADSLAGKLAERAVAKGAAKSATAGERDVVAAQRKVWGAVYRILGAVGRKDQRIAALLAEAARKR